MSAPADSIPPQVTRNLYAALCKAYNYVSAIAEGKQPAISAEGRRIASERMETIDGALADAEEYIGRGTL